MIHRLLERAVEMRASDLHLTVGMPPCVRIDGRLRVMPHEPTLSPAHTAGVAETILNPEQKEVFKERGEIDLSFGIPELGRFRINMYRQRSSVAIAVRVISPEILSLRSWDCRGGQRPVHQERRADPVTGQRYGKSTTLAAMINEINQTRQEWW